MREDTRVPDAVQRFFSGAPQSRDPGFYCNRPGRPLCSAPLRKSYALRCVRGNALHLDTCADTASHFPFCLAQQSV